MDGDGDAIARLDLMALNRKGSHQRPSLRGRCQGGELAEFAGSKPLQSRQYRPLNDVLLRPV